MCLSPQSARLRSDLHEETKTCFRGIPCTPSPFHSHSLSLSLSPILRSSSFSVLSSGAHTLRVRGVRTRRKEELAQRAARRAVLCILQWQRYYVKRSRAHTHVTKFLARSKKAVTDCSRQFVRLFSRIVSSLHKMDL